MNRKISSVAAALALALAMTGCAQTGGSVSVMQVSMLSEASMHAEKFAGMVVSENAVQIPRDLQKSVHSISVKVGDEVHTGDLLFSYDSEELSLSLDRQNLDLERLKGTVAEKKRQLAEAEKKVKQTSGNERLEWDLKRMELQADLTQAQYDQTAKEKEIASTKGLLENVEVFSPVDGTVRKIDESSADGYLVIQQAGAYRVQGSLNELSLDAGIREGTEVTVISRVDPDRTWKGMVTGIDYSAGSSTGGTDSGIIGGMGGVMGGPMGGMGGSTRYPFYVQLESTDGLLLGQHVYIQPGSGENAFEGKLMLPSGYLLELSEDQTTAVVLRSGTAGRLERQSVELGAYDPELDRYEIVSGITGEDYIADPATTEPVEGADTDLRSEADYEDAAPEEPPGELDGELPEDGFPEDELPAEPPVTGEAEG